VTSVSRNGTHECFLWREITPNIAPRANYDEYQGYVESKRKDFLQMILQTSWSG